MEDTLIKPIETKIKQNNVIVEDTLIKSQYFSNEIEDRKNETLLKTYKKDGYFKEAEGQDKVEQDVLIDGTYKIIKELGQGAMGKVYLVYHTKWNIEIAVKTIRLDRMSEDMLELFLNEAETWIELAKHPYITTAFYIKDLLNAPAIFIEYANGGSLADWLRVNKDIPLIEKIDKIIQISIGMAYAHSKKLIHRDLKPENILLQEDGCVKITDFGLAKTLKITDKTDNEIESCGTPPYMPPEQWHSAFLAKETADIYSFGIMCYEMIAGVRPFVMEEDNEILPEIFYRLKHLTEKPKSLKEFKKDLLPELDELVLKCLEKKPDNRFNNFRTITDKLKDIYKKLSGKDYEEITYDTEKLKADDLNNRALSYLDLNNEKKAEELWKEALSIDTFHLFSNINLALLYYKQNFIKKSEEIYRLLWNAIESDKKLGYYYKGMLELLSGDFDKALDTADEALFNVGDEFDLFNLKGLALLGAKFLKNSKHIKRKKIINGEYFFIDRFKDAENSFLQALQLKPNHYGIFQNLGHALWNDKRQTEAYSYWEKAANSEEEFEKGYIENLQLVVDFNIIDSNVWVTNPFYVDEKDKKIYLSEGKFANSFEISIFNAETGEKVNSINGGKIWDIFSDEDNSSYLIVNGINIKDAKNGKIIGRLTPKDYNGLSGRSPAFNYVKVSPDKSIVVGSRSDFSFDVWDLKSKKSLVSLKGKEYNCFVIDFIDNNSILLGGYDGILRLLKFENPELAESYHLSEIQQIHKGRINCFYLNSKKSLLFSGGDDSKVIIWDLTNNKLIQTINDNKGSITAIYLTENEEKLMILSNDRTLKIYKKKDNIFRLSKNFDVFREGFNITISHIYSINNNYYIIVGSSKRGQPNRTGFSDNRFLYKITNTFSNNFPIYFEPINPVFAKVTTVSEDISDEERFYELIEQAETLYNKNKYYNSYELLLKAQNITGFQQNKKAINLFNKLLDKGNRKSLNELYFIKSIQINWQNFISSNHSMTELVSVKNNVNNNISTEHFVIINNIDNNKTNQILLKHKNFVTTVKNINDNMILTADNKRNLFLWDKKSKKILKSYNFENFKIDRIIYSPNSKYVVLKYDFGNYRGLLKIFDIEEFVETESFGEDEKFYYPKITDDGRFLIVYAQKKNENKFKTAIKVIDLRFIQVIASFEDMTYCFDIVESNLWTIKNEKLIKIDLIDNKEIEVLKIKNISMFGNSFRKIKIFDKTGIFIIFGKGLIQVYDLIGLNLINNVMYNNIIFIKIKESPDQRFALVISNTGFSVIINLVSGNVEKEISEGNPVIIDDNWNKMVCGQNDGGIKIFNLSWDLYFKGKQPELLELQKEATKILEEKVKQDEINFENTLLKKTQIQIVKELIIISIKNNMEKNYNQSIENLLEANSVLDKTDNMELGIKTIIRDLLIENQILLNETVNKKRNKNILNNIKKMIETKDNNFEDLLYSDQKLYLLKKYQSVGSDDIIKKEINLNIIKLLNKIINNSDSYIYNKNINNYELQVILLIRLLIYNGDVIPVKSIREKINTIVIKITKLLFSKLSNIIKNSKTEPLRLEESIKVLRIISEIVNLSKIDFLMKKYIEVKDIIDNWFVFYGNKFIKDLRYEDALHFSLIALEIPKSKDNYNNYLRINSIIIKCYFYLKKINKVREIELDIKDLVYENKIFKTDVKRIYGLILKVYLTQIDFLVKSNKIETEIGNIKILFKYAEDLVNEIGENEKIILVKSKKNKIIEYIFNRLINESKELLQKNNFDYENKAKNKINQAINFAKIFGFNNLEKKAILFKENYNL